MSEAIARYLRKLVARLHLVDIYEAEVSHVKKWGGIYRIRTVARIQLTGRLERKTAEPRDSLIAGQNALHGEREAFAPDDVAELSLANLQELRLVVWPSAWLSIRWRGSVTRALAREGKRFTPWRLKSSTAFDFGAIFGRPDEEGDVPSDRIYLQHRGGQRSAYFFTKQLERTTIPEFACAALGLSTPKIKARHVVALKLMGPLTERERAVPPRGCPYALWAGALLLGLSIAVPEIGLSWRFGRFHFVDMAALLCGAGVGQLVARQRTGAAGWGVFLLAHAGLSWYRAWQWPVIGSFEPIAYGGGLLLMLGTYPVLLAAPFLLYGIVALFFAILTTSRQGIGAVPAFIWPASAGALAIGVYLVLRQHKINAHLAARQELRNSPSTPQSPSAIS